MRIRKEIALTFLVWLVGIVILILSVTSIGSLLIGAALGPIEISWFVAPLAGCLVGAALFLYAYRRTLFRRRWIKAIVFTFLIFPVTGLGILTGLGAGYIAAMPIFEDIVIIKRNVLFESGWHFVNSNSYFPISDKNVHKCIKKLGTKNIVATIEVTLHYGSVSYFRVLKYGECKVQFPIKNPNPIVPAYTRGEENSDHT